MIQTWLSHLRIASLNDMQEASLQAFRTPGDILLLSPTGSGKTLAFLLPLATSLQKDRSGVQALILAPSRELALQIESVFRAMGTGFKVACCYGGHLIKTEEHALQEAPALLIGTPGRIAFHLRKQHVDPSSIRTLVLDEFDKALEFGFHNDMEFILGKLTSPHTKILTSATKSLAIPSFVQLQSPKELLYIQDEQPKGLRVKVVYAEENDKLEALFRLVCHLEGKPMLVFCNHRDAVERISELLQNRGLLHEIFHGKMEQQDRERVLIKFRNGSHRLLVATDLAARGLDIPEIQYIVHYQLPVDASAYVHRNGRTARMHAEGTAYLLLREGEELPDYLTSTPEVEVLPESPPLPPVSDWATLYIGGGKKDKVNKVDIVGLLLQKGQLKKEELGLIEVLDHCAYAAVKRDRIKSVLKLMKYEKIKKKEVKIDLAR